MPATGGPPSHLTHTVRVAKPICILQQSLDEVIMVYKLLFRYRPQIDILGVNVSLGLIVILLSR